MPCQFSWPYVKGTEIWDKPLNIVIFALFVVCFEMSELLCKFCGAAELFRVFESSCYQINSPMGFLSYICLKPSLDTIVMRLNSNDSIDGGLLKSCSISYYSCIIQLIVSPTSLLYHAWWNIFFTNPDNAVDRLELWIKKKYSSSRP